MHHLSTPQQNPYARGSYNPLARAMKDRLSVPVLVAGRILDPDQAEAALAAGDCDLVAMTRAIIADPDLPKRAQAGETDRIRPCIAINEGCIGRSSFSLPLLCPVNPSTAREDLATFAPMDKPRRVVVVGGGPAGMEAARVAAERGHTVTLFEQADHLGGQVATAVLAPNRPHYGRHAAWLERELRRLGVEVRLRCDATPDTVLAATPESVIVATGAASFVPQSMKGITARCGTDVDLLARRIRVESGMRVLVYDVDGHIRGGSAAVFAALEGAAHVELATPRRAVCEDLDSFQQPAMYRKLAQHEVICTPHQLLAGPCDDMLLLRDAWSDKERPVTNVDLIVFVGYRAAQSDLGDTLADGNPGLPVQLVGDCVAPRRLHDAVTEGARAGNTV